MQKLTGEDLLRLARDAKKTQLRYVRLAESSSKLGVIKASGLPTVGRQSVTVGVQVDREKKRAEVATSFKLVIAYDEAGNADPAVTITATFLIGYAIIKPFPKKDIEQVLPNTSIMVVWPYWREFVQSITVRMGLPPFPISLMHVADIAEMKDGGDEKKPS